MRHRALLAAIVGMVPMSLAWGSAPMFVPLATMVAEAPAVAIVRIDKVDEIARPRNLPTIWYPNRTVTVRPLETIRGQLPETFTIRAEVSTYKNTSAKVGSTALVFVSGAKPGPAGELPVYEAAQGFRVVADLVPKGDAKANEAALNALVAATKACQPKSQHGRMWDPDLSDAAQGPILDLLKSKDPLLRRWAIDSGLREVHVTPTLGKRLIELLKDADAELAALAALMLTQKNHRDAESALRAYRKTIPAGKLFEYCASEVRGTLEYWKVLKRLDAMPADLAKKIGAAITERHTAVMPRQVELRIGKQGVEFGPKDEAALPDDVLAGLGELFKDLPGEMEHAPFRVSLHVFRQNGVVTWRGAWHR